MTEIPVNKDDLISIKHVLGQIDLSAHEMSLAGGSISRSERLREIGVAAATMQKLIEHYLSGGRDARNTNTKSATADL